jgi:PhzF family phenazine biosynthesis protein
MRQYLVDAFTEGPFRGNPACVVEPFDVWPPAEALQRLAMENNQAETAYLLKTGSPDRFGLRWCTPAMEVVLCGHATLASAHVLFNELGNTTQTLSFDTLSGVLTVQRSVDGRLEMDFPGYPPHEISTMPELEAALGIRPAAIFGGPALIAQLANEDEVRAVSPDLSRLPDYIGSVYKDRHVIVTALADAASPYDVVSRFFAPGFGIDEDPATGSMHCMLSPLFQMLTGKSVLDYYQAYPRRGANLQCEMLGNRVKIRGKAITILRGELCVSL